MQTTHSAGANGTKATPVHQFTEGDISDVADALNFLLSALDCPRSVRVLIHAMLGFVAGRATKVEFYHFDLARRAFSSEYVTKAEFGEYRAGMEERVRKTIQKMTDWQSAWNNLPITYTPGGKRNGETYPSSIKLPLITWAVEILNHVRATADLDGLPDRERTEIYRTAVRDLLRQRRVTRRDKAARRAKRDQSGTQIYRTLQTLAAKYVARKAEETHADAGAVINSFIWDLASNLEKTFDVIPPQIEGDNLPLEEPDETTAAGRLSTDIKTTVGENFSTYYAQEEDHGAAAQYDPLADDGAADMRAPCSTSPEYDEPLTDAQTTVAAFHSVGVTAFGLTLPKSMTTTGKDYQVLPVDQVSREIDAILEEADSRGWKLSMIRPCQVPGVAVIQCDDPTKNLEELRQLAFLDVNTSPNSNGQSWVAVQLDKLTAEEAARAVKKYFGADMRASGSMRCPGSRNRKYDPAPLVRVRATQPGLILTEADIAHMLPVKKPVAQRTVAVRQNGTPYVPDWSRVAAMHPEATPSHIDYYCALGGLQNGVSDADVTKWLLANSQAIDKRKRTYAKEYAERTTRAARAYLTGTV